ncbi:MAG: small multi-drug export protein [Clostridia bacterium]|nr:small multi-drug export protein [Clostridia bacterium]MBQ1375181.1 small multi-drug export protein [Clostridia bacterium]MBQ1434960.1 small multi-drug export protein [Clostridia bacterium]MBQ4249489.1 small multi-drug export protein [Clostridia bacterium]
MQDVLSFDAELWEILSVFLLSMIPVFELRGAIPLAAGLGMPFPESYILCVIGNMIPVPFIMLFARAILKWLKRFPKFERFILWIENKVEKNKGRILKYSVFGLIVFVMLPLPGTGAWTGALVATFLDMRLRTAIPCILIGVIISGLIMSGVSYGFLGFLDFIK